MKKNNPGDHWTLWIPENEEDEEYLRMRQAYQNSVDAQNDWSPQAAAAASTTIAAAILLLVAGIVIFVYKLLGGE